MSRYLLAGLLGALLAALAWIIVTIAAPIAMAFIAARVSGNVGAGAVTVTLDSNHLLFAAMAGFAAGIIWRRSKTTNG